MSLLGNLLGYFSSVWVVCVHFNLFIKLFLCRINKQTSLASHGFYCLMKSDSLHKINDYIYKDTEHKYFGC